MMRRGHDVHSVTTKVQPVEYFDKKLYNNCTDCINKMQIEDGALRDMRDKPSDFKCIPSWHKGCLVKWQEQSVFAWFVDGNYVVLLIDI